MARWRVCPLCVLGLLLQATFASAQTVDPSLALETWATVTDPMKISFDANENLFAGRDNSGSGGGFGDAVKIHRIESDGLSFAEYGDSLIPDPDAVAVDIDGIFGTVGAVLMGGIISNGSGGQIASVLPDETVVALFGPTTSFHNVSDMVFDSTGRFLFTNYPNPSTSTAGIFASTGAGDFPSLLASTGVRVGGIAVDPSDRIFVSTEDGRIQIYDSAGALIDANFVQSLGIAAAPLTLGQLAGAPLSLYTVNSGGSLLEVDMLGVATTIGSGFAGAIDLEFGADGLLYISELSQDRVMRVPEASGMLLSGIVLLVGLARARRLRGE